MGTVLLTFSLLLHCESLNHYCHWGDYHVYSTYKILSCTWFNSTTMTNVHTQTLLLVTQLTLLLTYAELPTSQRVHLRFSPLARR